ncbi:MAG: protein translocase SEC61 complex subunit gamma [Candidatus Hadarchaeales archaeon]
MKEFIHNCRRLFSVATKPKKEEYTKVAKITGLGMLLIGGLGFLIMLISYYIQGPVV